MNGFKLAEVGWRLTVPQVTKFNRNVQNCKIVCRLSSSNAEKPKICVVGAGPGK